MKSFIITGDRPTRDQLLMRQAEIVAERSTCARGHVGVVIAHDYRVVSQGYNGAPAGMPHCVHQCNCGSIDKYDDERGEHDESCPHVQPCNRAVHGEANAIAFAAKHGVATKGADLFTTMAPCLACSQLIINAGIRRVIYGREYRINDGVELLSDAGIGVWTGKGRGIFQV